MNRLLFCFLLLATSLGAAPATKFHDITRTSVIQSNSIFLVSTQDTSGRFRTRTIEADELGGALGLMLPGLSQNITYVNASGSFIDNGTRLTNAVKTAAASATFSSPVTVEIGTGIYLTPTNTVPSVMLQSNVRTYWHPGAKWWSGNGASGDPAFMFDDDSGAIVLTNCGVYGYGEFRLTNDSASVFTVANASSKVYFEAESVYVWGDNAANPFITDLGSTCTIRVRDFVYCKAYDLIYGSPGKLFFECPRVEVGGDIFEFAGDAANWGDVIINIGYGRSTNNPTLCQIGGKMIATVGVMESTRNASIYANGTTQGIIQDTHIIVPNTNNQSIVHDTLVGSGHTGIWFKRCSFTGATNVDPFNLTNLSASVATIFENCSVEVGIGATNIMRGATPSVVTIKGVLSASRPVPTHGANITYQGPLPAFERTNITTAVYTAGCFTNLLSDELVLMPNGTARTNRLPPVANAKGRSFTIADTGKTATGTNIWFAASGSDTFGTTGPAITNVTANGGSLTVQSDGTVWNIISRFQ